MSKTHRLCQLARETFDAAGVETLRRSLTDWLSDMQLIAADGGELGRYIGYYEPYATSHEALDRDAALQEGSAQYGASVVEWHVCRSRRRRTRRCPTEGSPAEIAEHRLVWM